MEKSSKDNNVNYVFKFLYAIGIIFITAGHIKKAGGVSLFYEWFTPYAFHLGLFTFASGYFYKDKYEENIKSYIWKKIKKLIIPMYIWNIVYGIFVQILKLKGFSIGKDFTLYNIVIQPLINGHQFVFTMGLWFVVPLFIIEVLNVVIRKLLRLKIKNINEYCMFVVSLILGMLGVYGAYKGYNKGLYLVVARVLYLIPFYFLGILYKRKLEEKDKLSNIVYFIIVFTIQLIIITKQGNVFRYTPSWCNDFTSDILMPFIIGFLGIAFWLRIAKIIEPLIKESKIINAIANNTYSIMVHQFLGFFIINTMWALASKIILMINFNWTKYKSDIWYCYAPKDLSQWYIIYLVAGIVIPIGIHYVIQMGSKKLKNINKETS